MATDQPKRIISARILARRLEISPNALSKYIRRELVQPDYEGDSGSFFDPALQAGRRMPQRMKTDFVKCPACLAAFAFGLMRARLRESCARG
jgi:hypothetical protein